MPVAFETFEEMKSFQAFEDQDRVRLKALGPLLAPHLQPVPAHLCDHLERFPTTAKLLEGRRDVVAQGCQQWLEQLFEGEYGQVYFQRRVDLGLSLARAGIEARWVEGALSLVRRQLLEGLATVLSEGDAQRHHSSSLLKLLDLDLQLVNLAYSEELLDRLTSATGMRRPLLINLIRKAAKG